MSIRNIFLALLKNAIDFLGWLLTSAGGGENGEQLGGDAAEAWCLDYADKQSVSLPAAKQALLEQWEELDTGVRGYCNS